MIALLQVSEHAHEVAQNGMNTTWTTANLFTIGAVVAGFVTAWIKMLVNKTKMEANITALETALEAEKNARIAKDDEIVAAKSTIKRELNAKLDTESQKIHDRISKTQDHHAEYMKKTDKDFKEINKGITDIQGKLGEILGRLKT